MIYASAMAQDGDLRSRHRPSACGAVAIGLLVVGCGSKASTSTHASSSAFLPIPACGGSADVTGMTPRGSFSGDTVSVHATLGGGTSIAVFVADSGSGALLSWQTNWRAADGGVTGANLAPLDEASYATFTSMLGMSVLATMVPGTVNVLNATNPVGTSDAGHGGQINEAVAFSSGSFQVSGSLTSPYCQITSAASTSP